MKKYILKKKFHQIFSFSKIKNFLYFCKTLIEVEKDIEEKFYSNCATFTDFTRIEVSLIPYVFEKPFYFTSFLRQICTETLWESKLLFVEKRYS